MKKVFLLTLMFVSTISMFGQATVWNPAANPSDTVGLWADTANWTNGLPDDAKKAVFNVPEAKACILDVEVNIKQFVQGDNGPGDTIIVADGGSLTTGTVWSAVGYNNPATLIVEDGGSVTFGQHMWVGLEAGADANVHLNGGMIHVTNMFALDWAGKANKDTLFLNNGVLSLSELHPTNSIGANSQIVISGGLLKIKGDQSAAIQAYVDGGKLIGAGNVYFNEMDTMTYVTGAAKGTSVWSPKNDTLALFTDFMNWSDYNVPDSNKVVFNASAPTSVLNDSLYIKQLVMGDNGDADTLSIVDGGHLVTGSVWSAIGYNSGATLVVEDGGMVTFGQHLWVGLNDGADSKVIIKEGGKIRVSAMFALDWNEKGNKDTVLVEGGMLDLFQIHETRSIGDSSQINITNGIVSIDGHNLTKVAPYIAAGKIVAFGGSGTVDVYFDAPEDRTLLRAIPMAQGTTVWNPANNATPSNKWTDAFNWSDKNAPFANKVVFNQKAITSVLDDSVTIKQLVMGDGNASDTLRIADGGHLVTLEGWSGVGYNNMATLVVDTGGMVTFAQHLWVGLNDGADATVILDGGTVRVSAMFALDWNEKGNNDTVWVKSGVLDLFQIHETRSIGDSSLIDITNGMVSIDGHNLTKVAPYIAAGRIVAFGGTGTVDVYFDAPRDRTLLRAVKAASGTSVWDPASNLVPSNKWSDRFNWADNNVPVESKVVFNQSAVTSVLDDSVSISQLVMGDGGAADTLRIAEGGKLVTMAAWSAVGYDSPATLVVDSGASVSFAEHLWVGLNEGADATVIVNGGEINVAAMFALDWSVKGNRDTVIVKEGALNLFQIHPTQSIGDSSLIDIYDGIITIKGHAVTSAMQYVNAGKIVSHGGARNVNVEFIAAEDMTVISTGFPVAVKKNAADIYQLYPNPVSSILSIDMTENVETLDLINILGKTVYSNANLIASDKVTIDVSGFENGVYFVRTSQQGVITTTKIIIN